MTHDRTPAAAYLRFVAWVVGVAALAAALGYLPTRRLGGPDAVPAMLAGCAVAVLASLVGGLPVLLGRREREPTPAERLNGMLFGLALRFGVALGLGMAVALSGSFARYPLLLWVAISYMALLAVDTRFALKGF